MSPLGDTILWSAIPVAALLLAAAAIAYWFRRRSPIRTESSQLRVERAYLAARNQAAPGLPSGEPGHLAPGGPAGTQLAGGAATSRDSGLAASRDSR